MPSNSLFGKRTLRVHVGILLFVAAIGVGSLLIYTFQTYVGSRESVKFGATLFLAVLTITSILITAENLRRGIEERRSVSAASFIQRYNDPKFFDLQLEWREVMRAVVDLKPEEVAQYIDEGDAPKLEAGKESSKIRRRYIAVQMFNFLEEIAIAINTETADEELLKRYFHTIIIPYYIAGEPWILRARQKSNLQTIYVELEGLVMRWRKGDTRI